MPDHDRSDGELRMAAAARRRQGRRARMTPVAPHDHHPLMETAYLIHLCQPIEERRAVRLQRAAALRDLQRIREQLAVDPTATKDDLEWLDLHIHGRRAKLDAEDNQLERSRMKTRERVARWRARKAAEPR
jgi:hypothetical protein